MVIADVVAETIASALNALAEQGKLGEGARAVLGGTRNWSVERPKRAEHGHLMSNVALALSKALKMQPRALAELLKEVLVQSKTIESVELAGPGFLNFKLRPVVFQDAVRDVVRTGPGFGRALSASGERIHLEFVSANPVGPMNVASGRNAILGDSIGRVLEAAGHRVTREYYVNDFGNQIRMFAESIVALDAGGEVPAEGYKGEYVRELATYLRKNDPAIFEKGRDELARIAITLMIRGIQGSKGLIGIRETLADLGVFHDVWFGEETLHRSGAVGLALAQLERNGYLQRKDGALFFVAKQAKEEKEDEKQQDKDRVVQKSDGSYTYFASDIAYHADKVARGYDRLITVLGADHHGYVARIENALEALGFSKDRYEAILYQLVFIYKGGELVKSSKRAGNFVTIEEVAEEVDQKMGRKGAGTDAIRFFFLSRSANSQVDFDIELATKRSLDNPVFYVQYGHARLTSVLKKAADIGITADTNASLEGLQHPDELAIALRLSEFPSTIRDAAAAREPHKIVFYAQELAREFQSYFTRLKADPILPQDSVRSQEGWEKSWDLDKTRARLLWVRAIRTVLAEALRLLGVSAPDRMDLPQGEVAQGEDVAEANAEAKEGSA